MLDKTEVIKFFDRLSPSWDRNNSHDPGKINYILDKAGIKKGVSVLDAACGTGVLFPFYLERGAERITGIDISGGMIAEAEKKFRLPQIKLICADIETTTFDNYFDCCVIYSAFPHFGNPTLIIEKMSKVQQPGGRLTVAHSESIEKINSRHRQHASTVSIELLPVKNLSELLSPFYDVDISLADENVFIVSGQRKKAS